MSSEQRKIRVAVVFGGRSTEHGVSCLSAGSVLSHLDPERFEVVPVGITREGAWVLGTSNPAELEIRDRRAPEVATGTDLENRILAALTMLRDGFADPAAGRTP